MSACYQNRNLTFQTPVRVPLNRQKAHRHVYLLLSFRYCFCFGSLVVAPLQGLEVRVCFSNGSEAILVSPKLKDAGIEFSYKNSSAKDKNGNIYPASENDFAGKNFIFFESDNGYQGFESFSDRTENMGWNFVPPTGGGGCRSLTYYSCSVLSNGDKKCTEQTPPGGC